MRCPRCGPRPLREFKRIMQSVPPANDARLIPIDVYVHQLSNCRRKVYLPKRIIQTA